MIERQKGFTLVEILVVLALSGIVMAAVYKSFMAQQQVYIAQEQVVGMQQDIRASLEMMMKEFRMAGYDPTGEVRIIDPNIPAAITQATASSITFWVDRGGDPAGPNPVVPDGSLKDAANDWQPDERISYSLVMAGSNNSCDADGNGVADVSECDLKRATGAGNPQPLAEKVEILNFVYLDADDVVIPTPITDAEQLARIRSIQICVVSKADKPDKHFRNTSTYSNLQGTVLLNSPNDGYRRRLLATTVKCRNVGI